jgi:hypothetical protein
MDVELLVHMLLKLSAVGVLLLLNTHELRLVVVDLLQDTVLSLLSTPFDIFKAVDVINNHLCPPSDDIGLVAEEEVAVLKVAPELNHVGFVDSGVDLSALVKRPD